MSTRIARNDGGDKNRLYRISLVVEWHLRLPAHVYPGEVVVGAVVLVLLFKHKGVVLFGNGQGIEVSLKSRCREGDEMCEEKIM